MLVCPYCEAKFHTHKHCSRVIKAKEIGYALPSQQQLYNKKISDETLFKMFLGAGIIVLIYYILYYHINVPDIVIPILASIVFFIGVTVGEDFGRL